MGSLVLDVGLVVHKYKKSCILYPVFSHLQMVQESARCGYDDVDSHGQLLRLLGSIGATHDEPVCEGDVILNASGPKKLFEDSEGLHGEFPSRWDDDDSSTCKKKNNQ